MQQSHQTGNLDMELSCSYLYNVVWNKQKISIYTLKCKQNDSVINVQVFFLSSIILTSYKTKLPFLNNKCFSCGLSSPHRRLQHILTPVLGLSKEAGYSTQNQVWDNMTLNGLKWLYVK
ncbi:Hypothetical_protein [Hexamita inflata]|uniref:Hypothetical_protein n=1 Tax=Hexamita inflata TaxID=28002 RepID=A0AA86U614_9EUKA|nr:Hypothetical protein HINF_LOCUS19248 [Hexamita inflata]